MRSMDLARGNAAHTQAAAPDRLSVRSSAAVIGVTSLVLWAGIILMLS